MKRLFINIFLVVSATFLMINFVVMPLINVLLIASMTQTIELFDQNLSKGTYHLVMQELLKFPQSEWPNRISALQQHFGYPLVLRNYDELGLSERKKHLLLSGEIITATPGKQASQGNGNARYSDVPKEDRQFWQRVGQSGYAVGMGPLPDAQPSTSATVTVWISILTLIGIILLTWVYFFWRKLVSVIATTIEFGNGNLDSRIRISRRSALAPLANAFNSMADRIQGLIQSHKDLTNAVSHELRTPLSRLQFGVEMLENTPAISDLRRTYSEGIRKDISELEEMIQELLAGIRKDISELEEMIQELLAYARCDRELAPPSQQVYELGAWVENLVASLYDIGSTITYDRPAEQQFFAVFNDRQLTRAIGNLIRNAHRYGNGTINLTINQDNDNVSIHVDDDGPGIPVADRQKVFDPFVRLDDSRSRDSGGVGLGLSIAKRAVEHSGGDIVISKSPLGGSRFTVKLTRCQQPFGVGSDVTLLPV